MAVLLAVRWRPSWRVLRHVVTIAHEGGHAGVALITGRRLHGIRLHSDTSGVTVSSGRARGPGMVATAVAGYPAPSVLGLLVVAGIRAGAIALTLWVAAGLLLLLLVQVRNPFGAFTLVVTGAAVVGVAVRGAPPVQLVAAYLLAWSLLLAGLVAAIELQGARRGRRSRTSDADQLARLTPLPALAWVGVFLALTGGSLVGGAVLLLSPLTWPLP